MRTGLGVLAVMALVSSGCGGDDSAQVDADRIQDELDDALEQLNTRDDDLAALTEAHADASATVEEMMDQLSDMEGELAEALEERDSTMDALRDRTREWGSLRDELEEALADLEVAHADVEALRVRFDPDIAAAVASAQQDADERVCVAAEAHGFDPASPEPDVGGIADEVLAGLPSGTNLDVDALEARRDQCLADGQERAVAAALTEPKGDGIWTVGLQIAPGLWRSTGTGDNCYWKRSPDGDPGRILNNHFGHAGGSVTLNDGEEFESTRCGVWEFAASRR